MKKPRADSKLKTLPAERQQEVIDLLRTKSHREVLQTLAASGLRTNSASLSQFWRWWHLRQHVSKADDFTKKLIAELAKNQPQIDAAALQKYAQFAFTAYVIQMAEVDPMAAFNLWTQKSR